MGPAPVGVTLLVLTNQDTKAHAGPPVAFVAEIVESDDLCLRIALGMSG